LIFSIIIIAHSQVGNFECAYRLFNGMMDKEADGSVAYRLGMIHVVGKSVPVNIDTANRYALGGRKM
jgi:pentatricopeptide repeat protein